MVFSWNLQHILCYAFYTGESSVEVKTEADSNDITEHPHDDKPRLYLCTVCDKRFTQKVHFNDHKRLHSGEKPFVCTVCDKRFRGRMGLNEHKLTTHSAVISYSCTQCEKRFSTQRCLKIHMNVHSSKYKCTECGKCFRDNQNLTWHRQTHSGGFSPE